MSRRPVTKATALFAFAAGADDEMTIAPGALLHVLQHGNDWCLVEEASSSALASASVPSRGLVPTNYIAIDLPPGWGRSIDDDGHTYYHNAVTGVAQWEFPFVHDENPSTHILPEIAQLRRGREEAAIEMKRLHKRLGPLPALLPVKDSVPSAQPTQIYTFSGGDLVWLQNNVLVFGVDKVAVMVHVDGQRKQTPLTGHKGRIKSICAHPNLSFFATQDAMSVFIWSSAALDEPLLSVLRTGKTAGARQPPPASDKRDLCCVSFSPCGSLLSVLLNGTVEVFDWQRSTVVAKFASGSRSGFDCKRLLFNPAMAASQRYALVSFGPSFIKFWSLSPRAYKAAAETAPVTPANEYRLEGNTWTPNTKSQPVGAPSSTDTFAAVTFSAPPSVGTIDTPPFSFVFTAHHSGAVWIWEHIVRKLDRHSVLLVPKPFGRLLAVVDDVHASPVRSMQCSADNVVVTCDDVSVSVWQYIKTGPDAACRCPLVHLTTFDLPPTVDATVGVAAAVRPHGFRGDGRSFDVAIGSAERSILRVTRAVTDEGADHFQVDYVLN